MKQPDVVSTFKDEQKEVTFKILAYRPVTQAEAIPHIRAWLAQNTPQRGMSVSILTSIGP